MTSRIVSFRNGEEQKLLEKPEMIKSKNVNVKSSKQEDQEKIKNTNKNK